MCIYGYVLNVIVESEGVRPLTMFLETIGLSVFQSMI